VKDERPRKFEWTELAFWAVAFVPVFVVQPVNRWGYVLGALAIAAYALPFGMWRARAANRRQRQ
jgi:hypothetical protein